ncbi:MAG: GFA family protein [Gammaproteobacteria bacterium]
MRLGGCQCGRVRYESVGEPLALYVCHCRECRKQSASAFGMSLEVPRAGLRVTRGIPKFWTRDTDSGGRLACAFCPNCGSRLWHEPEGPSETITIKAGSLDEPVDASSAIHIWVSRKLPGMSIPADARQFSEEPD